MVSNARILTISLSCSLLIFVSAQSAEQSNNERYIQTFTKVGPYSNFTREASRLREVSVYLKFEGTEAVNVETTPYGTKRQTQIKLWDGLNLRVISEGHARIKEGVFAFYFGLTQNTGDGEHISPTNQPGHGITADGVAAFHFMNADNSGPNAAGEKNLNAPGEVRHIRYEGLEMEIRVLEFELLNAVVPDEIPSFASVSCLVTVRETIQEDPNAPVEVEAQDLKRVDRRGFTVVEWGGTEVR